MPTDRLIRRGRLFSLLPSGPFIYFGLLLDIEWKKVKPGEDESFRVYLSGGARGTRTPDPLLAKQMRYQLRYSPVLYEKTPNFRGWWA